MSSPVGKRRFACPARTVTCTCLRSLLTRALDKSCGTSCRFAPVQETHEPDCMRRPIARRSGRVRAFPSEAILFKERPEILCQRAPGASIAHQLVVLWTLCRIAFCRSVRAKLEASFQHLGSSQAPAFGCQRSRPQICASQAARHFVSRGAGG